MLAIGLKASSLSRRNGPDAYANLISAEVSNYWTDPLPQKNVHIYPNGHLVSRISDWIIYSVEAEIIDQVVAQYGPCRFQNQRLLHPDIEC